MRRNPTPDAALKRYELGAGHLGNGLVVWNAAEERHGDYVKIALVQEDRSINYYEQVPAEVRAYVERLAFTSESSRSVTQTGSVFSTWALGQAVYEQHTAGDHTACRLPECEHTTNPPALGPDNVYGVITKEKEGRSARPSEKARTRFSILHAGGWHRVYANTHIAHDALFIVHHGKTRYLTRRAADQLAAAAGRADRADRR